MLNEAVDRSRTLGDLGIQLLAMAGMTAGEIASTRAQFFERGWAPLPGFRAGRSLSDREVNDLLKASQAYGPRDRAILYFALALGLRQIELRRLTWEDLEWDRNVVNVHGKGGRWREVPMTPGALQVLTNLDAETGVGPVFKTRLGTAFSESGMNKVLQSMMETAGIYESPHALRHTALTLMLLNNASLETAMEVAGHSQVGSHEVYARTSDSWLLGEWKRAHPLAKGATDVGSVYVAGDPFNGRMAKGVARKVLFPWRLNGEVSRALTIFQDRKQVTNRASKLGVSLSRLRDQAAGEALQCGAHPFLLSMMMGTTPKNIVKRRLHRQSKKARAERMYAARHLDRVAMVMGVLK